MNSLRRHSLVKETGARSQACPTPRHAVFLLLLPALLLAATPGTSEAQAGYNVTQITSNSEQDLAPSINNAGDIAWQHLNADGTGWQIHFYDRSTGLVTVLTSVGSNTGPSINNNGVIAYQSVHDCPPQPCKMDVFLYDTVAGTNTPLTNIPISTGGPKINDNGDVSYIWQGPGSQPGGNIDASEYEVFLYVASTGQHINVSNNSVRDGAHDLNNEGDVVWEHNPAVSEIYWYDRSTGTSTQITNDPISDLSPAINDRGDISWFTYEVDSYDVIKTEIKFRDATTGITSTLTDADAEGNFMVTTHQSPLNLAGDIGLTHTSQPNGYSEGIWIWDAVNGNLIEVASFGGSQGEGPNPVINAYRFVAWADGNEIYLAIPEGCRTLFGRTYCVDWTPRQVVFTLAALLAVAAVVSIGWQRWRRGG